MDLRVLSHWPCGLSCAPSIPPHVCGQGHLLRPTDAHEKSAGQNCSGGFFQFIRFRISSKSFFQVNPVQTEVLYQTALDLAAIKDNETVLDLCCGIGTITLLAAQQAKHVTGIEVVPQAIKDAKGNASHNGIMNADFVCADIETYLKEHAVTDDIVIADPPRSGLGAAVSHALGKSGAGRIVYVSCNPVTQKDDVDILKTYGYSPTDIPSGTLFRSICSVLQSMLKMSSVSVSKKKSKNRFRDRLC